MNPDNGPFMEGAYLAHAVYGFFQNGGNLAWIIRVGNESGRGAAAQAALPAANDKSIEALRAVALKPGGDQITIEITEDPPVGEAAKDPAEPPTR